MRVQIQPIYGPQSYFMSVSDHKILSGRAAVAASGNTPAVAAIVGTISSEISFHDISGRTLFTKRESLTPAQYAAWDDSVFDDDDYFTQCHLVNESAAVDTTEL